MVKLVSLGTIIVSALILLLDLIGYVNSEAGQLILYVIVVGAVIVAISAHIYGWVKDK